jgi:hypothetical protein
VRMYFRKRKRIGFDYADGKFLFYFGFFDHWLVRLLNL